MKVAYFVLKKMFYYFTCAFQRQECYKYFYWNCDLISGEIIPSRYTSIYFSSRTYLNIFCLFSYFLKPDQYILFYVNHINNNLYIFYRPSARLWWLNTKPCEYNLYSYLIQVRALSFIVLFRDWFLSRHTLIVIIFFQVSMCRNAGADWAVKEPRSERDH